MKLPLAFSLLCIMLACSKDRVPLKPINPHLVAAVPYKNGQRVRFVSNAGAVIQTTVKKETSDLSPAPCPTCTPEFKGETVIYRLFADGIVNPYLLSIGMSSMHDGVLHLTIYPGLSPNSSGGGAQIFIRESTGEFVCNGVQAFCLPTVTLNNTSFADVLHIRVSNLGFATNVKDLYYNKTGGLVGFTLNSEETYSVK
jgi:hypothetical protein